MWTFKASDLRARLLALGAQSQELETLLGLTDKLKQFLGRWAPGDPECEIVDNDEDPRLAWVSTLGAVAVGRWAIRVGIHGILDPNEEVLHVQHLTKTRNGTDMSGVDGAALDTLAPLVKTAWSNFLNNTPTGGTASPKSHLSYSLTYNEIRLSVVEYNTHPTKPTVHVPTRYYTFSPTIQCQATSATPYETAMVLTLTCADRDRRYRGRVYLGPFGNPSIGGDGKFVAAALTNTAKGFGQNWINGLHTATDYDVAIVSARSRAGHQASGAWLSPDAQGVGGVYTGVIPDVQRSRRKNLVEPKVLQWGTPPV